MRTPAVRLRLVGDGEDRAAIDQQVDALGLTGRVELVGFRPDPAPDLRAADVVVIPSRYDGMSLVLLEAMACGAAVVATRVPGTSALDGAGVLVPSGTRRRWPGRSMSCSLTQIGAGYWEIAPVSGLSSNFPRALA